jgi:hypothetical protein
MKATTLHRSGILKGGGRHGNPQDSTYCRYGNLERQRNDSLSHAEKGIVFDMNQLKTLLY